MLLDRANLISGCTYLVLLCASALWFHYALEEISQLSNYYFIDDNNNTVNKIQKYNKQVP